MRTVIILLVCILFETQYSYSQCPLNILESPNVSSNGLLVYLPFDGDVQNYGNGTQTASLSGATYTNGICGQALHFDGWKFHHILLDLS